MLEAKEVTGSAGGTSHRVIVVSGLSGAGKASILRALEDLGYEAVDNPPLPMVDALVRESVGDGARRLAIGVDARTHGFDPDAMLSTLQRLRAQCNEPPELVFASASPEALQRRFTQTRRRHPLAGQQGVAEGIASEQRLTEKLRSAADMVIDTTDLPLSELWRLIEQRFGDISPAGRERLSLTLVSFAFPAGLPRDADMVFDVRFLTNPHYVDMLRPLTGCDKQVAAFIESDPGFEGFFGRMADLVAFTLPRFMAEGKKYVTVAVGCTGGRHRSVHVVERLTLMLKRDNWRVRTLHRELGVTSGGAASQKDRILP